VASPGGGERPQRQPELLPPGQIVADTRRGLGEPGARPRRAVPFDHRQRRQGEAVLECVDRRQVGLPVHLDPADDHEHVRRRFDDGHAVGRGVVTGRAREQVAARLRAGGASPQVREVVRPRID
jgi:hypothetical protein